MVQVATNFIAAGGNRQPNAADWDQHGSGLLAYGAGNNIALWNPLDPTYRGSYAALSGHTKNVNVVKFFLSSKSKETIILSGAADNTIRIWASDASSPTGFLEKAVLTAHTASINTITVLPDSDIFVSGAADATIRSWKLEPKDDGSISAELLQTIDLKQEPKTAYFPLSVALARLSPSTLILASAGTKNHIQIYVQQAPSSPTFTLAATLKGHEDWIRSLTFALEPSTSDLLLASASQDKYTRLWRIHAGEELPAATAAVEAEVDPALAGSVLGRSLHNKAHRIADVDGSPYSITFEALLVGHEDWIYSAQWRTQEAEHGSTSRLQLLTTSADNSIAVWEADPTSGVWVSVTRLGEISAQKGATTATGSVGGFWIGLWSPDGRSVVSLGRTGGWRLWTRGYQHGQGSESDAVDDDRWTQRVAVTGHVRAVRDVKWARDGSYLLTTSADQTTRQFAQWKRHDSSSSNQTASWHEFSRPQIHGYDLNCLAPLSTPLRFVSGADEKLLRVFDQPSAVAELLSQHCAIDSTDGATAAAAVKLPDAANIPVLGLSNKAIETTDDDTTTTDLTAAGAAANDVTAGETSARKAVAVLSHPPTEDHLSRHLLWPEAEKLYGHGYEISSVAAAASAGDVVATACRATSVEHAAIRLYETRDWRQVSFDAAADPSSSAGAGGGGERVPSMKLHSLTVTGLAFSGPSSSPSATSGGGDATAAAGDEYLLSVGRDRVFGIWGRQRREGDSPTDGKQQTQTTPQYTLLHAQEKAHSRMLLGGSWAPPAPASSSSPSPRSRVFATAGRDSKVRLWRLDPTSSSSTSPSPSPSSPSGDGDGEKKKNATISITHLTTLPSPSPVTAVAFHPDVVTAKNNDNDNDSGSSAHVVLAFGTEKGEVLVGRFAADFGDLVGGEGGGGQEDAGGRMQAVEGAVAPSDVVNALAWRPVGGGGGRGELELAVGSDDGSVRVYGVRT
ncbi:rna polymerase ii elongator [Diplodia corticola]|uniref:Elongator complex protein 2 n=1 Tax=Diplodia corticola TaxID=236234 RepID=A0A1J9RZM8_9PEZI|nr:rna polymerase ii elongator [Diplodia corticola]OJD33236.1 rna polymerase ii elongator [Diplodia corticola]